MATNPPGFYVVEGKDENGKIEKTLTANAYVNNKTIAGLTFKAPPGADITDSLEKNKKSEFVSKTAPKGRTVWSQVECVYPNGDNSTRVALQNCIIQYRDIVTKEENMYGANYVCLGVPKNYITKIKTDLMKNSNIRAHAPVQEVNDYLWFNANLGTVTEDGVWFAYKEGAGSSGINVNLKQLLARLKTNVIVTTNVSISANMNNHDLSVGLDIVNGTYTIGIKITEVFVKKRTSIKGPDLTITSKPKETMDVDEVLFADDELTKLAIQMVKDASPLEPYKD